jgi:hypothetical protein
VPRSLIDFLGSSFGSLISVYHVLSAGTELCRKGKTTCVATIHIYSIQLLC